MIEPLREISPNALRRILLIHAAPPAATAIFAWLLYFLSAVFGFDVVALLKHREKMPGDGAATVLFWVAILTTLVAAGIAVYFTRRALGLARNGVEVVASITKVGRISIHDLVRVDYQYSLNGRTFDKSLSCTDEWATEYENGTRELLLICDPLHPERSLEKYTVLPD